METPVSDDEIDQALPGFVLAVAAEAERLVLAARSGTELAVALRSADDDGEIIVGPNGNPIMIPARIDPHYFVNQGIADLGASMNDPSVALYDLQQFRQGGPWDLQRDNGANLPQFRDSANVVIGLYAAALGLTPEQTLDMSNIYAKGNSNFEGQLMDTTYIHLPQRNVFDILLGYHLYQSGRVRPTAGGNGN
jgi:hypothetical protein